MRHWYTASSLALALGMAGCAQPGDPGDLGVVDLTPLTVKDTLVYLSGTEQQALLVDVAGDDAPRVRRIDLPEGSCSAQPRPGSEGSQLVVLCTGADATTESDASPAEVWLLDRGGVRRRYTLPGRFARIALSDDGQHAFAYAALGGLVLATETAFVNLGEAPSDENPRGVTVRSLSGESPTGAAFSPPMQVAGERRRFALALAPGHVNLFDLGHLDRAPFTVPLTVSGTADVTPQQVLFGTRTIYVRADGLSHVVALTLNDARESEGGHPFTPSFFTLALGEAISHVSLLERDDGRELVLALTPSSVSVIDVATGTPVRIDVGRGFQRALRFRGRSPGDSNVRERALLYGNHNRIGFLDLERLEVLQSRNLETVDVPAAVNGVYPMVEQGRVALLHGDETLISVVELEDRTVVPVRSEVSLQNALLDPERARLWLRTGSEQVASLSLADLDASEVLLDLPVLDLVLVEGDTPKLVAIHDDPSGHVTLLNPGSPTRRTATSLRGFLWEGLLDERTNAP